MPVETTISDPVLHALPAGGPLLWVGDGPIPDNVLAAAGDHWQIASCSWADWPPAELAQAPLVVASPNADCADWRVMADVLDDLERQASVAVFLLADEHEGVRQMLARRRGPFLAVSDAIDGRDLTVKLAAATQFQPGLERLHDELAVSRRDASDALMGRELNEQLQLAARLQRDFLPRRMPEVGPARFGVLFRPASWVSGDIYDIFRLDETHVGFYVVDAIGHGMPAALLTMFIKKALQTKRIIGNTYQLLPPHEVLAELNADICHQDLPSCQFCTAVYCALDVASLELTYARAGHPRPILAHADGRFEQLAGDGPLLGVFEEAQYHSHTTTLAHGDRIILYTDGADQAFAPLPTGDGPRDFPDVVRNWSGAPRDYLLMELAGILDVNIGHTDPEDDVTVLVMDV